MADKSAIEWTDATWNPVTGCSKVSPGCANCYAETLSLRFGRSQKPWTPENAAENVVLHPERLDMPLRWTRPRMVFVNSMSDLFHELVPDIYIRQVWDVMEQADRHTFQILTKRPERMAAWVARLMANRREYARRFDDCPTDAMRNSPAAQWARDVYQHPSAHIWLGTSIENNRWVSRADALRATPAAVRFLSCEPLLGPLPSLNLDGIDWVIVGGESGHGHRPMDPAWVRDIRDRCASAGVAFFFKQWGGRTPKSGGRELDGRTWDEMPRAKVAA